MRTAIYRKESFCATHRLNNPNWDNEKNERVFGKCNNPSFHGHNYELVVKVVGMIDPETGFVIDAKVLKDIIKENIIQRYDHKNLYTDMDDFSNVNPTCENIAKRIYEILRTKIDPSLDLFIILYETDKIFVEYPVQ